MTHVHYNAGRVTTHYPVIEITEHDLEDLEEHDDCTGKHVIFGHENGEPIYHLQFNGTTLNHLVDAYRALGEWLDERFASDSPID